MATRKIVHKTTLKPKNDAPAEEPKKEHALSYKMCVSYGPAETPLDIAVKAAIQLLEPHCCALVLGAAPKDLSEAHIHFSGLSSHRLGLVELLAVRNRVNIVQAESIDSVEEPKSKTGWHVHNMDFTEQDFKL